MVTLACRLHCEACGAEVHAPAELRDYYDDGRQRQRIDVQPPDGWSLSYLGRTTCSDGCREVVRREGRQG
jgi:hypothetical protein